MPERTLDVKEAGYKAGCGEDILEDWVSLVPHGEHAMEIPTGGLWLNAKETRLPLASARLLPIPKKGSPAIEFSVKRAVTESHRKKVQVRTWVYAVLEMRGTCVLARY